MNDEVLKGISAIIKHPNFHGVFESAILKFFDINFLPATIQWYIS